MKKATKAIFAAGALLYLYRYTRLKATRYNISSSKIKKDLRIVLLADLHSVCYGKNQELLLKCIEKQTPDIIAMAGDMVDDRFDNVRSYQVMSALAQRYKCFFVTGNHEYKTRHASQIKETLRSFGITVLEGQGIRLPGNICIFGVDDPYCGEKKFKHQYSRINNLVNEECYNILLQHKPAFIKLYEKSNFDLMLSGHTHGGQLVLPKVNLALYASGQGFFPKYYSGIHEISEKNLIISRGLTRNTRGFPRVFNSQEIVVIDLTAIP